MKVLITGASGFIGSRLAARLAQKGNTVYGMSHGNAIKEADVITSHEDLAENDFVVPNEKFDVVFHLAAATPMEKNRKLTRKINYDGTVNLFNKINDKTKFLVYVSGLGVFGDQGENVIDENTPPQPNTEYATVRLEAQKFLAAKCKEYSIPFTTAYLGEVYGNGGWFVSQIIDRLKKGSFRMPKAGKYYRCFVHVDDVVGALVTIAEKNAKDETFIITDSNPSLFKDFIEYTCDKLGVKHPGSVPTFLAKTVLGGDFVKLLTTSIKTSNAKISKLYSFQFPSYKEGIDEVISKIR